MAAASGRRLRSAPRRPRLGKGSAASGHGKKLGSSRKLGAGKNRGDDKKRGDVQKPGDDKKPGDGDGVSGRKDPFPGPAPLPRARVKKFLRGGGEKAVGSGPPQLRWQLKLGEQQEEAAASRAARLDLLQPLEPGFLEPDPGQDSSRISQEEISEAVDIASAAKHFELRLEQFGPYRLDYDRTGRHLLLGGSRGHVAALDWQSKALRCEFNVMEHIHDLCWLHSESLLAVAQRRWLHVYDSQGLELSCLKAFPGVLQLQFLPYHFLLAASTERGFLQFLDVSLGREVTSICTRGGRLGVMAQNPSSAIIHLGHSNGTVTLWAPSCSQPLAKLLCHRGPLRAIAVDPSGSLMATSGQDGRLRLWELRSLRALQELRLPAAPGQLHFSQRRLLAAACNDTVQVFKGVGSELCPQPYLCHRPPRPPQGLRFCPFEDVLGVGHGGGFSSLLVPGAGEANFDALEANPYRSRRQRQEWEVKALLEKIPAELITLDPCQLGQVDTASLEQKRQERIQRLGFDPQAKAKGKVRRKVKGSSLQHRRRQAAHEGLRAAIRQSVELREEEERKRKKKEGGRKQGDPPQNRGALERFKK